MIRTCAKIQTLAQKCGYSLISAAARSEQSDSAYGSRVWSNSGFGQHAQPLPKKICMSKHADLECTKLQVSIAGFHQVYTLKRIPAALNSFLEQFLLPWPWPRCRFEWCSPPEMQLCASSCAQL